MAAEAWPEPEAAELGESATAKLTASRSVQSFDGRQDSLPEERGDGIRVFVRVRPPTEKEQGPAFVFVDDETSSVVLRSDPPRTFTFDGVLGPEASQEAAFELLGRSVGDSCLAGYNGSIYVYGQTGTGKTYTMSGPVSSPQAMQFDEGRGVICRMLDYIFTEVARRRAEEGEIFALRCSFLEIYKEQITDLLEPLSTGLHLREDINRGVYVERLSEPPVASPAEAFQVLWRGLQNRHVGATHINERSSRSHAVFTLSVDRTQTVAGVTSVRVARLNLVDLAGSERQQTATAELAAGGSPNQAGQTLRVKEAGAINRSLSALTNVIMSLSRDERPRRRGPDGLPFSRRGFVAYRDSKLTFLLRDSLGGNSKTVICANISPAVACLGETMSTLKFTARAKYIRCAAVRNEEFSGTVESLMDEVKVLRERLSELSGGGASPCASPAASEDTAIASPAAEEPADADVLSGRKRARRLEVLLAATLERERRADMRREQLQCAASFLESLDARKSKHVEQLYQDFEVHLSKLNSTVSWDESGAQDLPAKLHGFQRLLGNLLPGRAEEGLKPGVVSERELIPANSPATSPTAPCPPPGVDAEAADEKEFLREENRRLRAQLEGHPEVRRLAAENRALRLRLATFDPAVRAGCNCPSGEAEETDSGFDVDPDSVNRSSMAWGPKQELTSEMLLRCMQGDGSSLRTGMFIQKIAKEVEDLLQAKEALDSVVQDAREGRCGFDVNITAEPAKVNAGADGRALVAPHVAMAFVEASGTVARQMNALLQAAPDDGRSAGGGAGNGLSPRSQAMLLRQALLRAKGLSGMLDNLNTIHGEEYEQFQQLREDCENRIDEYQFYERQITELDRQCHSLVERMRVRPGLRGALGSCSAAGLESTLGVALRPSHRSCSLVSLHDPVFWESRLQELAQVTGLVDGPNGDLESQVHHLAGLHVSSAGTSATRAATSGPTVTSRSAEASPLQVTPSAGTWRCTTSAATPVMAAGSTTSPASARAGGISARFVPASVPVAAPRDNVGRPPVTMAGMVLSRQGSAQSVGSWVTGPRLGLTANGSTNSLHGATAGASRVVAVQPGQQRFVAASAGTVVGRPAAPLTPIAPTVGPMQR